MKILSRIDTSEAQDGAIAQLPVKVCMHVVGRVHTDARVMREANTLRDAGFKVSIVDVESDCALPPEEDLKGICVKHMIYPKWFISTRFKPWFLMKAAQTFIRGVFRLIRISADIYHAQDEEALPACYIAARLRRKPLIYDAHELPLSESNVTRWHRLHALTTRLFEGMVPRCAGVITVSPPIAKELRRRYHATEVSLIRNFPVYQTVTKNDRLRQHLGLSPDTRIALYQGNLQRDRELDRLIRAAAFLERDIVIVMMGRDNAGIQEQLEALIASEGVTDRVKIIPPAAYGELLDWTASADIGLIVYSPDRSLNIQLCLPNKLFEYLMAGLPVLASSLDAVADILRTYDVGQVVSSLLPRDIGMAVNSMLADRVTLDRMHHNALESAQQHFCWEKESDQLIDLYRNILTKRDKQ